MPAKPNNRQAQLQPQWVDKIQGHAKVRVDQIMANEYNWRDHPKLQRDALKAAIRNHGFIRSVTINLRTSEKWPTNERSIETLVDGHLRVLIANEEGVEEIWAEFVDLTPDEERAALATMDPIGSYATTSKPALDRALQELKTAESDPALDEFISRFAEDQKLYPQEKPAKEEDEGEEDEGQPEHPELPQYAVIVFCSDLADQHVVYAELQANDYNCRTVMVEEKMARLISGQESAKEGKKKGRKKS